MIRGNRSRNDDRRIHDDVPTSGSCCWSGRAGSAVHPERRMRETRAGGQHCYAPSARLHVRAHGHAMTNTTPLARKGCAAHARSTPFLRWSPGWRPSGPRARAGGHIKPRSGHQAPRASRLCPAPRRVAIRYPQDRLLSNPEDSARVRHAQGSGSWPFRRAFAPAASGGRALRTGGQRARARGQSQATYGIGPTAGGGHGPVYRPAVGAAGGSPTGERARALSAGRGHDVNTGRLRGARC